MNLKLEFFLIHWYVRGDLFELYIGVGSIFEMINLASI